METTSVKMNVRSSIWDYFEIHNNDKTKAKCKKCGAICSRGKNLQKLSNASLNYHLSAKHQELDKEKKKKDEIELQRKRKHEEDSTYLEQTKRQRLTQPTLFEVQDKCKIWDINDPKSQKITRLIGM